MIRRGLLSIALSLSAAVFATGVASATEDPGCRFTCPDTPVTELSGGVVSATYFDLREGMGYASNTNSGVPTFQWRMRTACQVTDSQVGACDPGAITCDSPPDRMVGYYVVQRQRLTPVNGEPVDGAAPPPGQAPGAPFGVWETTFAGCVDVTDLNPPPSPDEVFRYFQTLPLPQLTTRQQPPGQALVGLPVIFFTDSPTTQTFTVDIRGFTVDIAATATSYTWDTGDGALLTTTDPGAPYPDQTITHDYSSGTYTASLTTTWGATFSVDSGVAAQVPGTTTTQGAPVTFSVRQARTVLTNPYD
jgi:hypothetical protein